MMAARSLPVGKLEEVEALITESHVVYTSGRHGSNYFNKDAIYPHTNLTSELCASIAGYFCEKGIEAVIAPADQAATLEGKTQYCARSSRTFPLQVKKGNVAKM